MITYIIKAGDTLYSIAKSFNITLNQLLAANPQIVNPSIIYIGQVINIPVSTQTTQITYVVQPGDSLYGIAWKYGITLNQLLQANPQIRNPALIYVGTVLTIPITLPSPSSTVYVVQPGDSLFYISLLFGTTVSEILKLNPGLIPESLVPRQRIFVPVPKPANAPGCVVYSSNRSGGSDVWRIEASGRNPLQLTRLGAGPVIKPIWSPNGKSIAFSNGNGLFTMGPCGKNQKKLFNGNVIDFAWSNDSINLAFSTPGSVYITDVNGATKKILDSTTRVSNLAWFPDNKRLAGSIDRPDEVEGYYNVLFTVDITGNNFKAYDSPYVPGDYLKLSPNGRFAAVTSARYDATLNYSYIYDFTNGNLKMLPEKGHKRFGGWSPDSSMVCYSSLPPYFGRYLISIAGNQGNIIKNVAIGEVISWGITKDFIIYTRYNNEVNKNEIYISNIYTLQQTKLSDQSSDSNPSWTAISCPTCA